VLHHGQRQVRIRIAPTVATDSASAMLRAALHGSGVALLPSFFAKDAPGTGEPRIVLPNSQAADLQICSAYAHRAYLPNRVWALVDLMAERFDTHRPTWKVALGHA